MRAFVLTQFDATPTIADVAVPEPSEGEVRVRVHAASINGFDLSVAGGYLKEMMEHRFPVVLGKDFAGVVDALGPGVSDYAVGDRVFGVVTKAYLGDGSLAEYVTVDTAVGLAKLPEGIDLTTGATLGLAGTAALNAVDAADIKPGETVVIAGATGGVGNQAIQLAKNAGATVIATAATDAEKELVSALGADISVDHTGDVAAAVRDAHTGAVDVVLHFAGDPAPLVGLVRDGGRVVSTIAPADQLQTGTVAAVSIYAHPDRAALDRVSDHHATGSTQVKVHTTYPWEQVSDAFDAFAAGTLGKIVVTVA